MELNVPTIAQRKAARRSQLTSPDSTSPSATTPPTSTSSFSQPAPEVTNTSPLSSTSSQSSHYDITLDKEKLIALAKTMGLELAAPKKIWIKHSYSVTPESKEKFSKYCEILGIKMQDGLEDALNDWFKKKENEFQAIVEAKHP